MIKGIHHVALRCCGREQFDRTVHFYRDVLGLRPFRAWGEGDNAAVILSTGNGCLEIFANGKEPMPQGVWLHVALATDNTDDCIRRVREAGYEVHIPPQDVDIASEPVYPVRIAFCHGPAGEEVEFFQER